MITVIAGVALFLLATAGLLAYQNSRLITEQEADSTAVPTGMLMYSVINERFLENEERPEAVPLFQYTVLSEPGEQLSPGETGTTFALCRVPAGTGEMILWDAQNWMVNNIRKAAIQGVLMEHSGFPDKAARKGEKELIVNLEATVKEETGHADSY
ncbi:hypothetical protein PAECIP111892_00412 [Paenibacillus auburnensis]|jgi:hypothetical protein|uniref:Uncharacterized protein n=2 Tax=Paenibacillus auburnensis TaxID=2905649 RepID=A0ABN8FRK2_9BACL|nr:hypothetical protein PAECIP111892_00412 [Paenibacillus auburnensis]